MPERIGIAVSGGPAPGILSVIQAVVRSSLAKYKVFGFFDGFRNLVNPKGGVIGRFLELADVEGIHLTGGNFLLRQSRVNLLDEHGNPSEGKIQTAVNLLREHGIRKLVTIGGEDTAYSAYLLSKAGIIVSHVPKTIDNDLPLPKGMPTFGFTTAVEFATREIVNLINDAAATNRWYIVVIMGRSAGHLALHSMISSGAQVLLIPEEFKQNKVPFSGVVSTLYDRITRLRLRNITGGVAVVSEGVGYKIPKYEIEKLPGASVALDENGHLRMSEFPLANVLKREFEMIEDGETSPLTFVGKDIGYELRCAPPVAFDIEYTQLLGTAAVEYLSLLEESSSIGGMVTIENGEPQIIFLSDLLNDKGKIGIRAVDTSSYLFGLAKARMEV